MIGRLGLMVVLLAATATAAHAQPVDDARGGTGFATYIDGFDTVIWTPYARAGATVGNGVNIDARWSADIITSASVDVITAATPSMDEIRNELGLTAGREKLLHDISIDGGYLFSFERDSDSHVGQLGLRRGFVEDNIEIGLRYAVSLNRMGVRGEPSSMWRSSVIHSPNLSLTYVINQRTMAELIYSAFLADGYLANPYRRVPIEMSDDLRSANWVDERVPDTRMRNALTARFRRALGESWVAAMDYRFYTDDWGVMGHMEKIEAAVDLPARFAVRLQQRFSLQGGADFYREHYTTETEYVTRDRRLSPNLTGMAGAAITWGVGRMPSLGTIELRLAADALVWNYDEFGEPDVTPRGTAEFTPVGWVYGTVLQFGLEIRP
jgi:hypothetical protein